MGLDIFAASHLKYARPIPSSKQFDQLEVELMAQGKGLDDVYFILSPNAPAHRQRLTGMKPGLYEFTKETRRHSFRAGSYSGYNRWRELLCEFALDTEPENVWGEPRSYRGRPFVELINFTDCDDRIGTVVSAKLAADFDSHARRAKKFAETLLDPEDWSGEDFLQNYRDFARGFRLAAKAGALQFC